MLRVLPNVRLVPRHINIGTDIPVRGALPSERRPVLLPPVRLLVRGERWRGDLERADHVEAHIAHLAIRISDGELCIFVSPRAAPWLPHRDRPLGRVARVAEMSDCEDIRAVNFAW